MDEKEAELIGMHVGDGTLYLVKGKFLVWEMRGSIHEKEYYTYVASLMKEILGVEMIPKYRGPNSYGIQTTNKVVTQFFIDNGFKPGTKTYTVSIPHYIKNGGRSLKYAFLRGLFDTDGCIMFEKNRTLYNYYPRIEFHFASFPLVNDLKDLFTELNFRNHSWSGKRFKAISICGFKNLDEWIKNVKPANSKHINRIKVGLSNKPKVSLKRVSTNL